MDHKKYDPAMERLKPGKHVGIVGESHIWDGPLDLDALPKGKGSSSGKYGMEISKAHCGCSSMKGPITQRAK